MRERLRCRPVLAVTVCIAVAAVAACSSAPGIDGGIVGTGNRIDCENQTRKDGAQAPVPEDCKRESAARR
jgi:hypothetical protein